ncbi:MAG: MMPL family transporter [Methylohalobius crimeensis]
MTALWLQRYLEFLSRWRWWVIVFTCLLVTAFASGTRLLHFTTDYRVFFSQDDPLLQTLDSLHCVYSKDDTILFILTPKEGRVFTRPMLSEIAWLTREAWRIPYARRVDSLQNFQYTHAKGDELIVEDLYRDSQRLTDTELKRIESIALAEPLLKNRLISPRADVTGVSVSVLLPGVDKQREVPEVVDYVQGLAKELERRVPDLKVHLTGGVLMSNAFPEASRHDIQTLVPVMFALVFVVMYLLLHSVAATLWAFLIILFTIASTMGLAGWLGFTISPPSATAPNIILTVAVADCVHVLISFLVALRAGRISPLDWRQLQFGAARQALRLNLVPVFLTSLTTALGFLSMNFSNSPPFRDLGNMTAMGVGFAFLYTLVFLPAMMLAMPARPSRRSEKGHRWMEQLAQWVIDKRKMLMVAMSIVVVGLTACVPLNELNDDLIKYFSSDTSFRKDTEYATRHLTGMYTMEYSVPAASAGGIAEPAYLEALDAFAAWFRQQPEVIHVYTLSDLFKRLNRNLHGDNPAWHRIPESRELAAQYLLLYEMSLPEGLELTDRINVDKSASRLTVTLKNLSSNEILDLERRARLWQEQHLPVSMQAPATGPNLIFAHIGQSNIYSMILGAGVAFAVIALVLVVALRSAGLGLLSLIPNVVPVLMAFGLWGLFHGQVNMGLAVVASMTLGIVVDDTVHFLSKWLHARRVEGREAAAAVRYAFTQVGTAMMVTSVVLAAGFLVLTLSDFEINAQMGLLTAITILLALMADLLFLPALLMLELPQHLTGSMLDMQSHKAS